MMRKMTAFMIAACMSIALLIPGIAPAEDRRDNNTETILAGMTLREKVSQMMIASFRVWQENRRKRILLS